METTQLKHFKVLAETENVTHAAEKLHLAQPALSRTLKNLENKYGLLLFDRNGKHLYLNENGKILLKYTNIILEGVFNMETELKEQKKMANLNVCILLNASSKFLPELVSGFKKTYPEISLTIMQKIAKKREETDFDIEIFSSMFPASDSNSVTLMEEEIGIAMPINHTFSNMKEVKLSNFKNESFLGFSEGVGLHNIIYEYCNLAGFEPKIILKSNTPSIIYDLIFQGIGITLVPLKSWKNIENSSKVRVSKIESPFCKRYVNMRWHSNKYSSNSSKCMIKYLIDFFQNIDM